MKVAVIMNVQHKLMKQQRGLLNARYMDTWSVYPVSEEGWDLEKTIQVYEELIKDYDKVVMVSPVPYLLLLLSQKMGMDKVSNKKEGFEVKVFHNSNRVKKELPNGRIISVVAEEGWQLV